MKQGRVMIFLGALLPALANASAVNELLAGYREQGAGPFSASAGKLLWNQTVVTGNGARERACTTCHGDDLRQPGKHVRTGKTIAPMALSVNTERLSKSSKVEKWFRRNCKWTLGRECTAQEKGDVLLYLNDQ